MLIKIMANLFIVFYTLFMISIAKKDQPEECPIFKLAVIMLIHLMAYGYVKAWVICLSDYM